jgi:hypothetical protein
MAWLNRAPALPIELAPLVASEGRLLAWAQHSDGFIAVTNNSLVSIDSLATKVTPWLDSLQAKWNPPQLTVVFQSQADLEPDSRTWLLDESSQLPRAVHDRVTAAVVVDRVYELPNAGRVRFVARKDVNQAYWTAIPDDLVASQSEVGQLEISQALAELRSSFGI